MADPRNLQQNRTPAFRSTGMFDDLIPEQNRQPRNPFDQFDEPQQPTPENPYRKYVQPTPDNPYEKYRQPNPFDQFDPPRPGMFDDLIPEANRPTAKSGMFDDLVAEAQQQKQRRTDRLNTATYLGQRADRGLADVLGAPVDLATAAINAGATLADFVARLAGGSVPYRAPTDNIGSSEWIADKAAGAYEGLGGHVVPPEDVSAATRIAGEGARFGAAGLAGGTALSSRAAQTAGQAPGRAASLLDGLAMPYRNSTAPLVGDVAGGIGSGAAVETLHEFAPDSIQGPLADIAAAMAGGAAGVTAATATGGALKATGRTARNMTVGKGEQSAPMRPDRSRHYTGAEMDQAARSVQTQASNPAAAARAIDDEIAALAPNASPGELPTVGALTDDPGLALLEREARARNPKPFIERDRAVAGRAGEMVRSVAPEGSSADDFTRAANQLDTGNVTDARQRLTQAERSRLRADIDARTETARVAENAGQGVKASEALDREITDKSLRPMQERKNEAFRAIDPDRTVTRDATPLIEAAGEIRDTLGRLNDPSSILPQQTLRRIEALAAGETVETVPTGVLDDAGNPITRTVTTQTGDGTITYGELNALRPELSAAVIKARQAGDFALADNIQRLQSAVNAETKRLAGETTPAGQRAAEAQRIYGEEFAPVWNVGPGDEARRFRRDFNVDRDARTTTPPSATAGRFLRKGEPEKAQSLRRVIESLPDRSAANAEARRYLSADLAESGVIDNATGRMRPDALKRWRNQWGGVLDTVPGLRDEIDDLVTRVDAGEAKLNGFGQDVRRAEQALDDAVKNKGALGLVLGKDPVNAVSSVFGAGDPEKAMGEIVGKLGTNSRARDGLKTAVADYMQQKVTRPALERTNDASRPVAFEALEDLFNRHEATLAKVYSAEEMNALRQAHRLLKPSRAVSGSGRAGALYDSKRSEQAWRLLEGGLKAKFGILKGGGILRTIRIFTEALPNSGDAISEIVYRMHFDPELARHLLTRPTKEINTPAWNKKLNRLLAVAAGGRNEGDQERQPLEITVTPGRSN